MMRSFILKKEEVKRNWFLVDAKDKILGRLSSKIAIILMGKNKATYTPHIDGGDGVIVINADKVKVTGDKYNQKVYQRYSGYPGGRKVVSFSQVFQSNPEKVIYLAVKRMLPKNKLGSRMIKRLKVYRGDSHPHTAQLPIKIEI